MAKLSQNWKKLSSKIQDKPKNGSVKKPTLKARSPRKLKLQYRKNYQPPTIPPRLLQPPHPPPMLFL